MKIKPQRLSAFATIGFPAGMLTVFFVIPFGIMIAVSFFQRVQGAFYEPAFVFDNYARFLTTFFGGILGFSIGLAALTAVVSVLLAFPFTYILTRMTRSSQVIWLVFLLSVLSLSEVLIGFGWSTLLSRTAGITNLFVSLGIMDKPTSLSPSFGAVLTGMVYQAFPYTVLVLYPALSRLDPSLVEAARTLGSGPVRSFLNVVVPALRNSIVSTLIMVFVFALGCYLLPQLLGKPSHWTLSVLITDQAIYQSNMPFAAAMAVFLVLVSLSLVAISLLYGKKENAA